MLVVAPLDLVEAANEAKEGQGRKHYWAVEAVEPEKVPLWKKVFAAEPGNLAWESDWGWLQHSEALWLRLQRRYLSWVSEESWPCYWSLGPPSVPTVANSRAHQNVFAAQRADAVAVGDAGGVVGAIVVGAAAVDAEDGGSSHGVVAAPLGSYYMEPTWDRRAG